LDAGSRRRVPSVAPGRCAAERRRRAGAQLSVRAGGLDDSYPPGAVVARDRLLTADVPRA